MELTIVKKTFFQYFTKIRPFRESKKNEITNKHNHAENLGLNNVIGFYLRGFIFLLILLYEYGKTRKQEIR